MFLLWTILEHCYNIKENTWICRRWKHFYRREHEKRSKYWTMEWIV